MVTEQLARACADLQAGRVSDARVSLTGLARERPEDPAVLHPLAVSLVMAQRYSEALPVLLRLSALQPHLAPVYDLIGYCHARLGRHHEALSWYNQALMRAPGFAACRCNAGISLAEMGRHEEALAHFVKAQALDPALLPAFYNGGNASLALDRPEDAVAQYLHSLHLRPGFAPAYAGIGGARQSQGRFAEARAAFEQAVAYAPLSPVYHLALALAGRFTGEDGRLKALEKLTKNTGYSDFDLACLYFALGKAYDDLKRPGPALAAWNMANAARRRTLDYDETAALGEMAAMASTFSPAFMAAHRGGAACELPVLIVGMARSGTTLVEQILASHPAVYGAGECTDLATLALGDAVAGEKKRLPPQAAMSPDWFATLGRRYAAGLSARVPSGQAVRRITDKMPDNFRYAGLFHLALPGARIVHVRRQPADTCLSCYSYLFRQPMAFSYDLAELGRYYCAYDRLMAHWRAVLPSSAFYELQYEDLVADFTTEARHLVAFCGLDWDERCARFHQTERVVRSASQMQVREPIYARAVGRWQPYAFGLAPLFEALGNLAPDACRG